MVPINMTGTGFDDFVSIISGYEIYFKDSYPIGEAKADVIAAFQYTNMDGVNFPLGNILSTKNAVIQHEKAIEKLRTKGYFHLNDTKSPGKSSFLPFVVIFPRETLILYSVDVNFS